MVWRTEVSANRPLTFCELGSRSITRERWEQHRRAFRDSTSSREERGLTQHPLNEMVDCEACDGKGEHYYNHSNPHGYGPDPQQDDWDTCFYCNGTGQMQDGHIDPLVLLFRTRWAMRMLPSSKRSLSYIQTRARCMQPSSAFTAYTRKEK